MSPCVYFPRLTMPISQVLTSLINFGIQAAMYLIFWVWFFATGSGVAFTLWALAIPFVMLEVMLLGLLSLPCVFGYNIWSDFHPILGKDVLDSEDFLVSGLLLPIGSLVYLLFCVSKWGWGFDKYVAEANKGKGLKFAKWLKPYFQFILPALIVVIFLQGLL